MKRLPIAILLSGLTLSTCAISQQSPAPTRPLYTEAAAKKWDCRDEIRMRPDMTVVRISQGVATGNVLNRIDPEKPPAGTQEQTVYVQVVVDDRGTVACARPLEFAGASNDPALQSKSVDAAKQWTFKPYLLNGRPISVETVLAFQFKS
jgi:outer membrane biosynthesis protein TonB